MGGIGIGLLYLPALAPFVEEVRLKALDLKEAALQAYHTQFTERFLASTEANNLRKRIAFLETELMAAQLETKRAHAFLHENEELRRLLKLSIPPGFIAIGARILMETEGQRRTLLLNIGTDHGVCQDAAVVGPEGLLGRVIRVGGRWSQALCVTDGTSRIPVCFHPSGIRAVLVGDFSPMLRVDLVQEPFPDIPQEAVTSEIPGVFPGGIPVGPLDPSSTSVNPAAFRRFPTHACVLIPSTEKNRPRVHP